MRQILLSRVAWMAAPIVGALACLPVQKGYASGCSSSDYLASICWTAASFCPYGFSAANGQILSVSNEYEGLFALLGNRYGGDGQRTFALPDLRGRTQAGTGTAPDGTLISLGQTYGTETVTLTADNVPAHTHEFSVTQSIQPNLAAAADSGDALSPEGAVPGGRPSGGAPMRRIQMYSTERSDSTLASDALVAQITPGTTTSQQNDSYTYTHSLRPPQLALTPCIRTDGTFPQQPR
ncbi:MAG: phage tail protein [Magnetovibrionaceae bacterium]